MLSVDPRGTRRPLATWQLWHPPQLLMHLARPPTPVRCPSPAMSRACRPLILPLGPSRAPLLSTQQMVADKQLAGCGGQWGVSAGEQVGRLVGWGGSGCRGIARGPQAPVELCCCLCLRRWPQVPPCLYVVSATQSCASKSGMVHTHSGMPSWACVSISNQAQINLNQVLHTITKSHFKTRHPSNDNTSTPKKCAQTDLMMWLMRVCP